MIVVHQQWLIIKAIKANFITYSLAGAILFLLESGVIEDKNDIVKDNIVNKLKGIKQQEQNIFDRVNHIMNYKNMFQCKKVNKKSENEKRILHPQIYFATLLRELKTPFMYVHCSLLQETNRTQYLL